MGRQRHGAEQINTKLREAEVELARGKTAGEACRKLGITEQTYYPTFPRWAGPISISGPDTPPPKPRARFFCTAGGRRWLVARSEGPRKRVIRLFQPTSTPPPDEPAVLPRRGAPVVQVASRRITRRG